MQSYGSPRHHFLHPVFVAAAIIIGLGVLTALYAPAVNDFFGTVQAGMVRIFGWFYMLSVASFVVFCILVGMSSFGDIRLGPDHSRPEYSNLSWFAMLFSAGMGIGLLFFSVAEPIQHYVAPPEGAGATAAAAKEAMSITFFHWGLHGWATYCVVGLALAYNCFRFDLPLTIRSALYPVFGEKIHGFWGHLVDTVAVVGTMFGVATSLGFGANQVASGLEYVYGLPNSVWFQVLLIALITAAATASVVSGLDKGIRRLSELNMYLAVGLLFFVLVAGPTLFLLKSFSENIGTYLTEIVGKTFKLYAYEKTSWMGDWTLFYWGWWIAWSPFVGMFIARVSRGRTIREFVWGVLLIPVGFTFFWMTCFGNTALFFEMQDPGIISTLVANDKASALFAMFDMLPLSNILSTLGVLLVLTFFVTSSDSGSLVIDIITAGGRTDPPVAQRVFWAITEGVVAATLLVGGGLLALQTAALVTALPVAFVLLLMCYGLVRGLRRENWVSFVHSSIRPVTLHNEDPEWRQRLRKILHPPSQNETFAYIQEAVVPALQEVASEFERSHIKVSVQVSEGEASLETHSGPIEFYYAVRARPHPVLKTPADGSIEGDEVYRAQVFTSEGSPEYSISGYSKEQVISDILWQYDKHRMF